MLEAKLDLFLLRALGVSALRLPLVFSALLIFIIFLVIRVLSQVLDVILGITEDDVDLQSHELLNENEIREV